MPALPEAIGDARPRALPEFPGADDQAAALRELAQSVAGVGPGLQALATAVTGATKQREAVDGLFEDLRQGLAFIGRHRLKLAASVPAVLVAIGAISPNAAHLLSQVLQAISQ